MKNIALIILLNFSSVLLAQSESNISTKELVGKIESLVKRTVNENNIPALSVSLVYDGEPIFHNGYGTIKRGSDVKADEHTPYQTASISKMLTGIIAKNLALENRLDLNEKITAYLPNSLSKKSRKKLETIRVIDVLQHQSGLPEDSRVLKRKDGEPMIGGFTEQDLLLEMEKVKLKSKPRAKFIYSNLGFALMTYILQRAGNLSYEELLNTYVVGKYDLKMTTSDLNSAMVESMAIPYRKDSRNTETKPWETGVFVGASGVFSTVDDLTKVMIEQLKAYQEFETNKLKSPLVLTEIKKSRGNEGSYYGMGLFEDRTARGSVFGHRGDMDGYASEYSFNPDTNTGTVLLTSSGGKWIGILSAQINKILETAE